MRLLYLLGSEAHVISTRLIGRHHDYQMCKKPVQYPRYDARKDDEGRQIGWLPGSLHHSFPSHDLQGSTASHHAYDRAQHRHLMPDRSASPLQGALRAGAQPVVGAGRRDAADMRRGGHRDAVACRFAHPRARVSAAGAPPSSRAASCSCPKTTWRLTPQGSTLLGAPGFATPILMAMLPLHIIKRRMIRRGSNDRADPDHHNPPAFPIVCVRCCAPPGMRT